MNENHSRHVRSVMYTALYALPLNFRGLIVIPVLTNTISIDSYGTFVVVQTFISLFAGILNSGLEASLSRFLPANKGTLEGKRIFYSIFWTAVCLNLVAASILIAFREQMSSFASLATEDVMLVGGIVVCHSLFGITVEHFRAVERYNLFLVLVGMKAYSEIVAIVLSALLARTLSAIFLWVLIVNAVHGLVTVVWVIARVGKPVPPNAWVIKCLKFSIPLAPSTLSDWIINLSDRFLIAALLGSAFVGVYNPGYALGSMILFVPTIFVTMLPPIVARLHDTGQFGEFDDIIVYTMKYFLLVAVPVFFGSMVISKPLLLILSNAEIAARGYLIVPIVAFGAIFFGVARIFLQVLQANLKTAAIAKAWIIAAVINFLLNVIFLRSLGIIAAAISTTIAFIVAFVIIRHHADASHRVPLERIPLLRVIFASGLMALVVWTASALVSLNVVTTLAIGIVSYLVFVALFDILEEREKKLLHLLLHS